MKPPKQEVPRRKNNEDDDAEYESEEEEDYVYDEAIQDEYGNPVSTNLPQEGGNDPTELSSLFPSLLENNNNKKGFHFPLLEHLQLMIDGPYVNVLEVMLRLVLAGCPKLVRCYLHKHLEAPYRYTTPCEVGPYAHWQDAEQFTEQDKASRGSQSLRSESSEHVYRYGVRPGNVPSPLGYINLPSFESLPINARGLEDLAIKAEGGRLSMRASSIAPKITPRTLPMSLMSQLSSVCEGLRHLFLSHIDIMYTSHRPADNNKTDSEAVVGFHMDDGAAMIKHLTFPNLATATLLDAYFYTTARPPDMLCPELTQLDMTMTNRSDRSISIDMPSTLSAFKRCEKVRTLRLYANNYQYGRPPNVPIKWETVNYPPHLEDVVVVSDTTIVNTKFLGPLARDAGNHLRRLLILGDG